MLACLKARSFSRQWLPKLSFFCGVISALEALLLVKACQARLFEETSFDLGRGDRNAGGVGCSAMEGALQLPDQPLAGLVSL